MNLSTIKCEIKYIKNYKNTKYFQQSNEYDLNKAKGSTADIWTAEGNQDVTTKTMA